MKLRPMLVLIFTLAATPLLAQGLPRVYLAAKGADPSGFTAPGSKERGQVLKELTNELRGKKKVLTLVENPAQADVTLELDAEIGDGSSQTSRLNRLSGAIDTSKDKAYLAVVTLKAGDYSTEFTGEGMYPVSAARQLAKPIEAWVKDNAQALIAKRKP